MKKRELQHHVSAKGTNYYLMRLGLLEKRKLDRRELTPDDLPSNLHVDRLTGQCFTVEERDVPAAEAELFLQTRRTRSEVLRNNAVIGGIAVALFIFGGVAQEVTRVLGG